jgi:hypothetical protein
LAHNVVPAPDLLKGTSMRKNVLRAVHLFSVIFCSLAACKTKDSSPNDSEVRFHSDEFPVIRDIFDKLKSYQSGIPGKYNKAWQTYTAPNTEKTIDRRTIHYWTFFDHDESALEHSVTAMGPEDLADHHEPFRMDTCILVHGYGIPMNGVSTFVNPPYMIPQMTAFGFFVRAYWGKSFVDALHKKNICRRVTVILQESIDTTLEEMTDRTVEFISKSNGGCRPTDHSCGILGHSKGGAVVTNMARQCMAMTSGLGKETCEKFREFYSATSVGLGSLTAVLVYGTYLQSLDPLYRKRPHAADLQTVEGVKREVILANARMKDMLSRLDGPRFAPEFILGTVNNFWEAEVPFDAEKDESKNPAWADLSGMRGGVKEPAPLLARNSVKLDKAGWLKGEFAASAVAYNFDRQDGIRTWNSTHNAGCWRDVTVNPEALAVCIAFGFSVARLHVKEQMEPAFNLGLNSLQTHPYFAKMITDFGAERWAEYATWANYQKSDGFAEKSTSAGKICDDMGTAVASCITFGESNPTPGNDSAGRREYRPEVVINHFATTGAHPAAAEHILSQLANSYQRLPQELPVK